MACEKQLLGGAEMEMLKGVLIAFDVILMVVFFGFAVYSATKQKDTSTAIVSSIVGVIITLNEAFIFLA